ncbi:MAG: hypothetical protein E7426_03660 [Ruminococcaceae bacterium]|jgi:hypothetical protein|nr:hypothetical protein [Oscillospiraceae bacterium]
MSTQGYDRYRGRGGPRLVWIIVLLLILLGAVAFLVCQRYLVYDEDGRPHWELPFGRSSQEDENPISPEDVNIEREDPKPDPEPEPAAEPRRLLEEIHARELENGSLWWNTNYVLSLLEEAMSVEVKRPGGSIAYFTDVEMPKGVIVEQGVTRNNLVTLLGSDHYAVARISCFRDDAYAAAMPDMALCTAEGRPWPDGDGRLWLDPGNAGTLAYLTALCRECAELGFDEILLDAFCYPVSGETETIDLPEELDRTAVLIDFAAALRKALPEETVLSVALRGEMGATGGSSGLTAELLTSFDRIYVDESADLAALESVLPADFDRAGGLALLTKTRPESGGYLLLP